MSCNPLLEGLKPFVSIVVPVYNSEKYIAQCIESIINQEYKLLDIILVDDGSTDNSGSICDSFAAIDSRIRVYHKNNGGLGSARNAGLAEASGYYIQFVDSDDVLSPQCVGSVVYALDANKADCCRIRLEHIDSQGRYINDGVDSVTPVGIFSGRIACEMLLENRFENWSVSFIARVDLYRDNGIKFYENTYYEDIGTTYKVLLASRKVVLLESYLYKYRKNDSSITATDWQPKKIMDRYNMLVLRLDTITKEFPELAGVARVDFLRQCPRIIRRTALLVPMPPTIWTMLGEIREGVTIKEVLSARNLNAITKIRLLCFKVHLHRPIELLLTFARTYIYR